MLAQVWLAQMNEPTGAAGQGRAEIGERLGGSVRRLRGTYAVGARARSRAGNGQLFVNWRGFVLRSFCCCTRAFCAGGPRRRRAAAA